MPLRRPSGSASHDSLKPLRGPAAHPSVLSQVPTSADLARPRGGRSPGPPGRPNPRLQAGHQEHRRYSRTLLTPSRRPTLQVLGWMIQHPAVLVGGAHCAGQQACPEVCLCPSCPQVFRSKPQRAEPPFPPASPPADSLPSGQAWATSSFRPLLPRKLGRDASRGGASRGRLPLCFPFASLGLICQPQHHASPLARPIPARKCPGPPSRQAMGTAGLSA